MVAILVYVSLVYILANADDLVLLAPSPNATRNMLKICDEF